MFNLSIDMLCRLTNMGIAMIFATHLYIHMLAFVGQTAHGYAKGDKG